MIGTATRLLIDSDTGIDDAMGLFYALRSPSRDQVVGITTLSGNASVEDCTRNALRIVEMENSPIPVVPGASVTLLGRQPTPVPHVHGAQGHGYAIVHDPERKPDTRTSTSFIHQLVDTFGANLTIAACGPLTNIANAIAGDRDLFLRRRPTIVWMGGAIRASGNVSPVAEFNAASDPEAAQLVLHSDLNVTMLPLDVTERHPDDPGAVALRESDFTAMKQHNDPGASYVAEIATQYLDFYETVFGTRASQRTVPLPLRPQSTHRWLLPVGGYP